MKKYLKKNFKKKTFKKRFTKRAKHLSLLGKTVVRKFELDIPIYVRIMAGNSEGQYTFSNNPGGVAPVNLYFIGVPLLDFGSQYIAQMSGGLYRLQEAINMFKSYGFFKIAGANVKFVRSQVSTATPAGITGGITTLPALSLVVGPWFADYAGPKAIGFTESRLVEDCDNALRVQVVNTSTHGVSKYFPFKGIYNMGFAYDTNRNGGPVGINGGYALFGDGQWLSTTGPNAAPSVFAEPTSQPWLYMGYSDGATFSIAQAGTLGNVSIGKAVVTLIVHLALPIVTST